MTVVCVTHSGGEERAGLELLQTHGAGVSAKEQDEGHEGDVWDKLAGLPHQLAFVLQALCLCERRPCGIHWLHRGKTIIKTQLFMHKCHGKAVTDTIEGFQVKHCDVTTNNYLIAFSVLN